MDILYCTNPIYGSNSVGQYYLHECNSLTTIVQERLTFARPSTCFSYDYCYA